MTGKELIEQIKAQRTADHCCIKSWGEDHKLVDFELIDSFIARTRENDTFTGFELLDLEQMWQALTNLDPDNLTRLKTEKGEMIVWLWRDNCGKEIRNAYPFSAEGIMTIMNDELFA